MTFTKSAALMFCCAALLAACDGDDDGGPAVTLDCATYCASMASTCNDTTPPPSGTNVQYTGLTGTCESYCGTANTWPTGTAGAASGNTLACRVNHVGLAAAEAAGSALRQTHCQHAGPSGGNVCGSWCENYCFLAIKNCGAFLGTGTDQMGFTDNATCLTACAGFATNGTINANSNSVQCRIYHAGAAGSVGALPHCGHAAVNSVNTFPGTAVGPCG